MRRTLMLLLLALVPVVVTGGALLSWPANAQLVPPPFPAQTWTQCSPWNATEAFTSGGTWWQGLPNGAVCIVNGKPRVLARNLVDWSVAWATPDWPVTP